MTASQELTTVNYELWLLRDDTGTITLTGWSETPHSTTQIDDAHATTNWPHYTLCSDADQLPDRLDQLGINLAAGHRLDDLNNGWDVYVRHPDITALRALLDATKTHHQP